MKYLYFDIECCDGHKICSFGYVIADENFNILEKEDIVINPDAEFRLGRDKSKPRIELAYQEETFYKQPTFNKYYNKIKSLLTAKNQILLGHSITSDIHYLKNACKRYDLPEIKVEVYDTQDFYYQLKKTRESKCRSLDKIVADLGIDIGTLREHKSCDDAELSMLEAKEICAKLGVSISELIELCDNSKRDSDKLDYSKKGKRKQFEKDLRKIAERYADRYSCKAICLSNAIKETDYNLRLALIKEIFKKGYNYVCKASDCDYFVVGKEKGKRDASCDYNIKENHKDIEKINLNQLSKMLNIEINENGEYVASEDEIEEENEVDSLMNDALMKSLQKQGISYEEWKKRF